ncbi:MAG: hypothetical protein OEZ58_17000 [Gammaproteobacteria bacterium]|nr:hypothetical protein [Gammaproteobacteria bacterium]MDH5730689.1 hypothetical protein [Gammaproteobacteria bacterium]
MNKTKLPEKWARSNAAIRATQIGFDTSEEITTLIRMEAVKQGLSPSDMVRKIVGLPVVNKPKRPRLTVSLSEQDYQQLAQRYGFEEVDKLKIKKQMYDELTQSVE